MKKNVVMQQICEKLAQWSNKKLSSNWTTCIKSGRIQEHMIFGFMQHYPTKGPNKDKSHFLELCMDKPPGQEDKGQSGIGHSNCPDSLRQD